MFDLRTIALAAGLSLLVSTEASAQSLTYGYGGQTCGKFLAAAESARKGSPQELSQYLTWTSGFVSAESLRSEIDYFHGTDLEGVQLWLENYCRANPLETFTTATLSLVNDLLTRMQRK